MLNNKVGMQCYRQMKHLLVKMGLCSLNLDPLDFKRNTEKIIKSIQMCKDQGCSIRLGSQLQVSGYHCADHFAQYDTVYHCWEVIRDIIRSKVTDGIVCDIGCPVLHKAALYNCRVILFNSKVVAIRPKMIMADGDNYFETRWFAPWRQKNKIEQYNLPISIQQETNQVKVPIGIFIINFKQTSLAYEVCQESWISRNPMIEAALDGAQLFVNPSASFIERGKLKRKMQMMTQFTERHGGAYAYINMKGTSGDRTLLDGGCFFSENGKIKYLSKMHSLQDIEVTPVVANLNAIRTFRLSNKSFQKQSNPVNVLPRVEIDFNVVSCDIQYLADDPVHIQQTMRIKQIYEFPHATYEPCVFLWEYLRKSRASGFFLPLSGGLDSCTVALIVYNMCCLVFKQINQRKEEKEQQVLSDLRKILRKPDYYPDSVKDICGQIFFTIYMGTSNSSQETKNRARIIAQSIGANHDAICFDKIYKQFANLGNQVTGLEMKFKKEGGTQRTDLTLQNIQSRSRMVLSYMFASLVCEKTNKPGFLLVLGSANLDEALRGYFTKYDCSSADCNPIGSFSKNRLKEILKWNYKMHGFQFIPSILKATPTAELRPLNGEQVSQTDEQDMGFTYQQLMRFGTLRKIEKLGPVSMFDKLLSQKNFKDAEKLAEKVKKFFIYYGINRHKMTTITPSFHYDPESCDDNRFDMRPFLYETDWNHQFSEIDALLDSFKKHQQKKPSL